MNTSVLPEAGVGFRWLQSDHPDLIFYNVPRHFPWPDEEPDFIDLTREFPFHIMLRAVPRLPQKDHWQHNIWKHLGTIFEESKPLNDAIERGQFREAREILLRLDNLHPLCPFIQYTLGFISRQQGHGDTAVEHYQKAASLAPNLEYVWMRFGEALEQYDAERIAIAAYRQALRLLPGHPGALEALMRLGEVAFLGFEKEGQRTQKHMEKEEYREIVRAEQKRLAGDIDRLFVLAEKIYAHKFCFELALEPLREILVLQPNHVPSLCYVGTILRSQRRFAEAAAAMHHAIKAAPDEAWPDYELAAIAFAQQKYEERLPHLERCLALDPNLEPALRLRFHRDRHLNNGQKEELLAQFGREKNSWQALILASEHALDRGETREEALKLGMELAAEACRLFPDQREVLLHYTGILAAHGEHEWVAALTRPKLKAGEQDPQLRWQYAGALHALRLPELALEEVRAALAGPLPGEWRGRFDEQLARWIGLIARADVALEIHGQIEGRGPSGRSPGEKKSAVEPGPKPVLRRAIYLLREDKLTGQVFPAAVPLGLKHRLMIQFETPRDSARIQLQQGYEDAPDLPPLNLGVFEMTGLDVARLSAEPPYFHLHLHPSGHLEADATQGERRLPVTWSLYPRPAVEENELPSD